MLAGMPCARRWRPAAVLAVFVFALAGCSKDDPNRPVTPMPVGTLAPDFSLADVNPASPTGFQGVSPRSKLNKISAWYFGHAT